MDSQADPGLPCTNAEGALFHALNLSNVYQWCSS